MVSQYVKKPIRKPGDQVGRYHAARWRRPGPVARSTPKPRTRRCSTVRRRASWSAGYAATSLDAVAKRARVTKGAIYHHFASKRDLFMAVLERQEETQRPRSSPRRRRPRADPWSGIVAALDAFLETISDPVYQRLCFVEGPAALGFEDWWACGERYEIGSSEASWTGWPRPASWWSRTSTCWPTCSSAR